MSQAVGIIGRLVDGMIRRTVRQRFHRVYWIPPANPLPEPCILTPNHHGWHDGHVMYHAATAMKLQVVGWVQEFDAFPSFASVGGMPFPAGDTTRRAVTIRRTVRLMSTDKRSLLLFPERTLHPPPEVLPFARSLEFLVSNAPSVSVIPVAIRYEMSMHERPDCFVVFGPPVEKGDALCFRTRLAVKRLLDELTVKMRFEPEAFEVLSRGTSDRRT